MAGIFKNRKKWKGVPSQVARKWLQSCRLVLSPSFSGCYTQHLPLVTPLLRLVTTDYEEDLRMTAWAIWLAWPLPLAADCLAKCHICKRLNKVGDSGNHSLESDAPTLWWAPSPHLFFVSGTRPVNAPHSACAQVAYELTFKWTIKKRSEQVIFLCLGLFAQNVSLVIPLHISSDPSCVSVYRSWDHFFSDTSSVASYTG